MQHPTPKIDGLPRYVGGKTKAANSTARLVKLSSNENPYGCSPAAMQAYANAAAKLNRYPEDGALSLREAIGTLHGFAPEQIICGTGSDEILNLLVHAYAGPGDEVLFTEHAFAMYRIFTLQHGATPVAAPETAMTADVDALLAAVTDKTRLLFLANPNNPTGTCLNAAELKRLRDGLREDIVLVLDGAYAELVQADDFSDGRELVADTNTVLTRTFSKVYGLPALRLGWGYGPAHIIDVMYQLRPPFNLTAPAIAAGIAAINDQDFIRRCVQENGVELARIRKVLAETKKITVPLSQGNFWLLPLADHALSAAEVAKQLSERGIIVREVANYGLEDYLRISTGTHEENDILLQALTEIL
jgi:histidinol-phosphate aminotransferase